MVQTVLLISGIILLTCIFLYNSLVSKRNQADNAFATIDVMLKKRFDLVPNLVAIAKQYAEHEKDVFTQIAGMRNMTYGDLADSDKIEFDRAFNSAGARLIGLVESYPELKASENFLHLQRSLNETEEQLAAARRTYNAAVTDYNNQVETFPSSLIANMFKFTRKAVFRF